MRYLAHGGFGIILGVGGAAAIVQAHADRPVAAAVIAVLTAIVAFVVFLAVDRRRST